MKFNRKRFMELTNNSDRYYDWNKDFLQTLDRLQSRPSYDFEKHDFGFYIRKDKKNAHYKSVRINLYDDGRIEFVGTHTRMDKEEMEMAYMAIAEFIYEMQIWGVIY